MNFSSLYTYAYNRHNSLVELNRPSDILIVERRNEVKLYFTFFKVLITMANNKHT